MGGLPPGLGGNGMAAFRSRLPFGGRAAPHSPLGRTAACAAGRGRGPGPAGPQSEQGRSRGFSREQRQRERLMPQFLYLIYGHYSITCCE